MSLHIEKSMDNKRVKIWERKGMCRRYARELIETLKADGVTAEPWMVEPVSGYSHTFVIAIDEGVEYLMDPIGVDKCRPFIGLLREAPNQYKKRRLDNWLVKEMSV